MNLWEQLSTGAHGLADHPFRTFLTMLGIVFGVAAVIAMVSIGAGAEREALEELKRFGANSIRVTARPVEGERLKEVVKKLARGLSVADAAFLRANCPFLEAVVAEKVTAEKVYAFGRKPLATVVGVDGGFLSVSRLEVAAGRFLTASESAEAAQVAVLGAGVASEVFGAGVGAAGNGAGGAEDACGQVIQVGRHRYRVVGVMREQTKGRGKLAIKSRDHDRDVYVPLPAAQRLIFPWPLEDKDEYHEVSGLWIAVREGYDLPAVRDTVMRLLKRRHREVDDLEALVPLEILQQSQKTQQLFNLVMALIAGISLLVGGIGIMNIMLASVNERTREIGVRRAMGAARRDIVVQFLAESSLISLIGGALGILVGIGLSLGIAAYTGWTTVIPASAVLVAFTVSLTVGIVFGLFPAIQAAKLDPVIALRYE
ncbi:MAG: FtsX-like permease family protein [Candidatus Riflebacteria bacterium]|nr:FtsX-like permease family protein [Candidatus Riflebacteria bacterium]